MKFYHVSNCNEEIVKKFIPRVPECRATGGENNTIPRICVAKNISECLSSFPEGGASFTENFFIDDDVEYSPIRVYEFDIEDTEYIITPEELYKKGLVSDAVYTNEYWITKEIEPSNIYNINVISFIEVDYPSISYEELQECIDEEEDYNDLEYFGKMYSCEMIDDISGASHITMLEELEYTILDN